MESRFKEGDRVRMLPDHEYSYQATHSGNKMCEGIIIDVMLKRWDGSYGKGDVVYRIKWSNGNTNTYTNCHIESIFKSNKDAKSLLLKH